MNSIKKFFDKKKADAKFKLAGEGRSLAGGKDAVHPRGAAGPSSSSQLRHPDQGSSHSPQRSSQLTQPRSAPTADAHKAGAAALARSEFTTKKSSDVNWSVHAIKAQARREMEAEQKLLQQMKLNENMPPVAPREVRLESAPMLAVQQVLFHCPLISSQLGTYEEVRTWIRDFLYAQIGEDKAVSACLIIHTCNKNKEKVQTCIETLNKYIENIIANPKEEKFRKIRVKNHAFQERVEPLEGTNKFLQAAGFTLQEILSNDATELFWVFHEGNTDDLAILEQLRDTLVSAEPVTPQLDRGLRVLLPAEAASHTDLPPQFYRLSTEELKREQLNKTEAVERSQMLQTKAMREKSELREIRKYRFSLIRVRFPDGLILQGIFAVYEKFCEVVTFVRENLVNDWRPFFLSISGGGKVTEEEQTLVDLRLVPAVMLNFNWDGSVQDEALNDAVLLKPEVMMLLQTQLE